VDSRFDYPPKPLSGPMELTNRQLELGGVRITNSPMTQSCGLVQQYQVPHCRGPEWGLSQHRDGPRRKSLL